jgi:uncharacterized protein (DUF2147 family)
VIILAMLFAVSAPPALEAWGLWKTPDNDVVRIGPCGPLTCGWLETSDEIKETQDLRDTNNPDPNLKGRVLKGLQILSGFTAQKDAPRLEGGHVYDPDEGKTYTATLTLMRQDRLKVTGCIIKPICRTETWTRSGPN